jgi:hypothetical protein
MVSWVVADDLKFKGLVREVGLIRDNDHFHSFNITVGIVIRSDKRLTYDEAERLSGQFRRRYLGKEVDLLGVTVLCPICGKGFNSEGGMKKHVKASHPERVDIVKPSVEASREEKPKRATKEKVEKPRKKAKAKTGSRKKSSTRPAGEVTARQKEAKAADKSSSPKDASKVVEKPVLEAKGATQTRLR